MTGAALAWPLRPGTILMTPLGRLCRLLPVQGEEALRFEYLSGVGDQFDLALGVAQRILRPVALAGLSSDGLWQRQARTQ